MANLPTVCLLENLMPPVGYELECLVGTTYSLNPKVLLSIVLSASIDRAGQPEVAIEERSKEEILFSIKHNLGKCLLFCDHHGPLEGGASLGAYESLALNAVIKKEGRANNQCGSLHAKLLLAFYRDAAGNRIGRVFVGSKNFTESTFVEFGVVLGLVQDKKHPDAFTRSLREYLQYLKEFEAGRVTIAPKLDPLQKALAIMKDSNFTCGLPGTGFHWQGRKLFANKEPTWSSLAHSSRTWLKGRTPGEIFVHSPWTRKAAVAHLMALGDEKTRIYIKCLSEDRLSTVDDERVQYALYHGSGGALQPYHSHAKIYVFRFGRDALLVFGSANLTPDGWGIEGRQARMNAELLVTLSKPFAQLKELADVSGAKPENRKPANGKPDPREEILDFLSSIRATLDYDTQAGCLRYQFEVTFPQPRRVKRLEVVQDFVEPADDRSCLQVFAGATLSQKRDIAWDRGRLYLLSPVLRLRDSGSGVETHLVLDLDGLTFFEGQDNLACLSYTPDEFVDSLARLMSIPLPGTKRGSRGGSTSEDPAVRFLNGLRLERYAYRMARLKHHSPLEFKLTMGRIDRLMAMAAKKKGSFTPLLEQALDAINRCHAILNET